jgi:hypothetical protein
VLEAGSSYFLSPVALPLQLCIVHTASAVPSSFARDQVVTFEWMSIRTDNALAVDCPYSYAPKRVHSLHDGFDMVRINATTHAAQMVALLTFWYWTTE